ncbi:MAG: bifunctional YncE family protein/alkaline phosphatase family protein, partial [Acidobacteriales bacterium]|nr:bifunctional YncE family protein/alkaline phosphatase family protein [Terriglobales bacterium]
RYLALLNDGYGTQQADGRQSIAILDVKTNQLKDFPDARFSGSSPQTLFVGVAFSSDGKHVYASVASLSHPQGGGEHALGNGIAVYAFDNGNITPERFLSIGPQPVARGRLVAPALQKVGAGSSIPYPAGLAVVRGPQGDSLLVADNLSDNVVLVSIQTGQVTARFDVSSFNLIPGSYPYTVIASHDGTRAWCSLWNSSEIAELDLKHGKMVQRIAVMSPKEKTLPGSHPTALLLSHDEKYLYAALSNADRVAVIETRSGIVTQLLDTTIPGQQYAGTTPIGLAETEDGKRLFVADASLNAIAVFDTAKLAKEPPRQLGFIPTDWYPSALAVVNDDLFIATAKGQGTGPNNGPNRIVVPNAPRQLEHPYIATLLYGSLARGDWKQVERDLPELTRRVQEDNLFNSPPPKIAFAGGSNPIRHVIYVLKENRTYDQVLGDLPVGNGDRSLNMYGAAVTPNEHKLAQQFGVLDNFYDSGEVSGDGHEWSTAAITSDYNERTWQITYRGREHDYDYGGTNNNEFPLDRNLPDVDAPATGYLWDNLQRSGMTYRVYGEFIAAVWCKAQEVSSPTKGTPSALKKDCPRDYVRKGESLPPNVGDPHGSASPWPWPIPIFSGVQPAKAALRGHYDPQYPDFEVDYPDQLRADEFLNNFAGFAQDGGQDKKLELPQFTLIYLPDDHTGGTRPGKAMPSASVADNDLALGRIVEAVSHSRYWDDTAIFVLEDDAQNGFDHVDAHRSIAFVISKYSPGTSQQPFLDHHFYTTVSALHTMETLLGLPPMNQNDGYAPVMAPLFSGPGTQPPFTADRQNLESGMIYRVNPPKAPGGKQSSRMDFSLPDAIDSKALNAILWRDWKANARNRP